VEQSRGRQFQLERFANSRNDLSRQQRMAAEVEEICPGADLGYAKDFLPNSRQFFFDWIGRSHKFRACGLAREIRSRQCFAIDFAVRSKRQRFQKYEG